MRIGLDIGSTTIKIAISIASTFAEVFFSMCLLSFAKNIVH